MQTFAMQMCFFLPQGSMRGRGRKDPHNKKENANATYQDFARNQITFFLFPGGGV